MPAVNSRRGPGRPRKRQRTDTTNDGFNIQNVQQNVTPTPMEVDESEVTQLKQQLSSQNAVIQQILASQKAVTESISSLTRAVNTGAPTKQPTVNDQNNGQPVLQTPIQTASTHTHTLINSQRGNNNYESTATTAQGGPTFAFTANAPAMSMQQSSNGNMLNQFEYESAAPH